MNADAHTNLFIVHTRFRLKTPRLWTHTLTNASFRNGQKSFSTFCNGQIRQEQTHTHTHISVCDLSQCHASTDSIRGEPLFFVFFLSVVLFFDSPFLSHMHTISLSQIRPESMSRLKPRVSSRVLNLTLEVLGLNTNEHLWCLPKLHHVVLWCVDCEHQNTGASNQTQPKMKQIT